jgi:hypothetical protein
LCCLRKKSTLFWVSSFNNDFQNFLRRKPCLSILGLLVLPRAFSPGSRSAAIIPDRSQFRYGMDSGRGWKERNGNWSRKNADGDFIGFTANYIKKFLDNDEKLIKMVNF